MNNYILMRKNDPICSLIMTEEGYIYKFSRSDINDNLAPLEYKTDMRWLAKWWANRSLPVDQGIVDEMLRNKGMIGQHDYLLRNLGLSLNDYYWIRPLESKLKWEDVNLYDNDFKENLLIKLDENAGYISGRKTSSFTPNSSLQGQLEKTWQIKKGCRILIKGNSDDLSCESLNEVFASMLHEKQGYDNYTPYKLIKIKDRNYAYGCVSDCFTNQSQELVTAWAILSSEKKNRKKSDYENLIDIAEKHGIDASQFRRDLEYQIMTDYILSNRDRHMNNIGVLRDAKTLKFTRMAPIYDTGRSMFVRRYDLSPTDITNYDTNSFYKKETKLLSLVTDKSLVNASKLPDANDLAKLYKKEPRLSQQRIDTICNWYELKVKAFKKWQNN